MALTNGAPCKNGILAPSPSIIRANNSCLLFNGHTLSAHRQQGSLHLKNNVVSQYKYKVKGITCMDFLFHKCITALAGQTNFNTCPGRSFPPRAFQFWVRLFGFGGRGWIRETICGSCCPSVDRHVLEIPIGFPWQTDQSSEVECNQ